MFHDYNSFQSLTRLTSRKRKMAHKVLIILNAAVLVLAIPLMPSATAATITWTGTTGDWTDLTNWGGILPTSSDDAYITNGGTANMSNKWGKCNNLYLGDSGSGNSGTVQINGDGGFGYMHCAYIGYSGIGTFTQSGGNKWPFLDAYMLYVGYNLGSSGTFNMSGSNNQLWANYEYIGLNGSIGLFMQSGETNIVKAGLSIRPTGQYTFSGGTMQITGGLANSGVFDFCNGPGVVNVAANSLVNLALPGSSLLNTGKATLNVGTGSLLIVPAWFDDATTFAHYSNQGMLHIAGTPLNIDAGQTISGWGAIGDHVNCKGTIKGNINFYNGFTLSDNGAIGNDVMRIDDINSEMNGGYLASNYQYIGYSNTGLFNQSGGNNSTFFDLFLNLYLGYKSGVNGTYNLSGTGFLGSISTSEVIGYSGTGTFNQTGGLNTIGEGLILGNSNGSSGTYNLTGGTLVANSIVKGLGNAYFNFGGGTIQDSVVEIPMKLTGDGGNANFDSSADVYGILSGPGGLNKFGSGSLYLYAINTYTGPTSIYGGTLSIGSAASIASPLINVGSGACFNVSAIGGGFILKSGQTLKGSGKIIGNITINGVHAPGDSTGIETVQGNYNMLGQLQIELAGTDAGAGYDQVLISGPKTYDATLGGALVLDWTGFGGSSDSSRLWILENDTAGGLSGAFANYANGNWLGNHDGRDWFIWYQADAATGNLCGGNDVLIAPVPEPNLAFLLLSAAMAMALKKGEKRKKGVRNHL
jgi:autotransporter-associated beta strand protein